MRFFHYSQNNSGGSFDYDQERGITHHVIIEADGYADANQRAEEIGLYFNGCAEGRDCSCCGDRWWPVDDEGDAHPMVYGSDADNFRSFTAWMEEGREICVHYANGKKVWHGVVEKECDVGQ